MDGDTYDVFCPLRNDYCHVDCINILTHKWLDFGGVEREELRCKYFERKIKEGE